MSVAVRRSAPLVRMLVAHTRAQWRIFSRNLAVSSIALVMPVVLFAFVAMAGASEIYAHGVTLGAYMVASLGAYAVSSVMVFNFGATVAIERGQKVDVLLRAAPLPPAIYLVARAITALVFACLALGILCVFAAFAAHVQLPGGVWLEIGGRLLLGAVPFIGLGFAIAYLAGANAAVALTNLIYMVLAFASGLFIPLASLPEFVRNLAPYLPTFHYAQLAWQAVGMPAESLAVSTIWLSGYALVFFAAAAWAYRREQSRRFG